MSSLQQLFTSRKPYAASTFVAGKGKLFYNELTGQIRLGDGVTAGGQPIAVTTNIVTSESILPETDNVYGIGTEELRWQHIHLGDGGVHYNGFADPQIVPYIPGEQVDDIIPALDNNIDLGDPTHRFANLYLGYDGLFLADQTTDANINITVNEGTLYIDGAENLRLGNLAIRDTTLTSANNTLDISIGDAGDTGFFYVKRKAQIDNTTFSSTQAMLGINASGVEEPTTIFPDTLVQTVSRPNKNSRVIQRSYGSTGEVGGDNSYAVWGSYAARGSVAAPSALKANDILMRLSGNGYGTSTWGSGGARVEFVALENFTDTAKGTKINFWTTPEGQLASQNVASINSTGVVTAGVKFSNDNTLQTTAGIPLSAKAVSSATYVATLGIDGKLDATQIPASLTGAIVFKGTWNADTNSPELSDSLPAGLLVGWEYVVDVGGTRNIGDGSKTFAAGDFVIFDGTHWKQVPSGNLFTSLTGGGGITVNQSTGAMVLGSNATPNATTSTIVSRDASGNFAANVITANLTGVVTGSVSGNAGSVTNGVYITGDQNIGGNKTFTSTVNGTITNANLATTATNAQNVVGGIGVATLTAGTGTAVSANSGTVTVWNTIPAFNTSTLVATAVSATTAKSATTATNLAVATSLFAGKLSAATGSIPKNSVATVTYTITGLTTNHKIIITPGTVMPDRQFSVTAAWVSAADTVSIQYANNTGGALSATLDINYLAFV